MEEAPATPSPNVSEDGSSDGAEMNTDEDCTQDRVNRANIRATALNTCKAPTTASIGQCKL